MRDACVVREKETLNARGVKITHSRDKPMISKLRGPETNCYTVAQKRQRKSYKFTEHMASGDFTNNKDIWQIFLLVLN